MNLFKKLLSKEQIIESQAQSHELWSHGTTLERRTERLFSLLEMAGPDLLRASGLVDTSNRLLSSMKCYGMEFTSDISGLLSGVGLGAIFTPPEFRKRGYAAALIEHVLNDAKKNGMAFAFLFSDIDPTYYKKFGFVEFPAISWSALTATLPQAQLAQVPFDMREAKPTDLKWLIDCYDHSFEPQILHTRRTQQNWLFYRKRNDIPKELIFFHAGKAVGFVSFSFSEEKMILKELAWLAPSLLNSMWATLRLMAEKTHATTVEGWIRPEYLLPVFQAHRRTEEVPMIKSLIDGFNPGSFHPDRFFIGTPDYF